MGTVIIETLSTELQNDPENLGYAPFVTSASDQALADILNFVRDGTTPCPTNEVVGDAITVRRDDIAITDLYAAINVADYTALPGSPTAAQLSLERRYLSWLTGLSALENVRLLNTDGSDTPVIGNFKVMFQAGTGTINRVTALANRNGSRIEELFGPGTVVTPSEVGSAR